MTQKQFISENDQPLTLVCTKRLNVTQQSQTST